MDAAAVPPDRPRYRRAKGVILYIVFIGLLALAWDGHWSSRSGESAPLFKTNNGQHKAPNANSPPVDVFYHIFIPNDRGRKGFMNARRIVESQLRQVEKAAQAVGRPWTLHYTTTGSSRQKLVTHEWIEKVACGRRGHLKCVTTGPHLDVGNEEVTLHQMRKFCSNLSTVQQQTDDEEDDDDRLVIYLHSKGSYHSSATNEVWRQALTHAATHPACLASLQRERTPTESSNNSLIMNTTPARSQQESRSVCNVCGLQFYPLWTHFFPGNMFAAQCSYVRKLLDPQREYPERLAAIVHHVHTNTSLWKHKLYNFGNPSNVGLDRFAAEHWIGSHPTLRPCDIQRGNHTTVLSLLLGKPAPGDDDDKKKKKKKRKVAAYQPPLPVVATPAPRVAIDQGDWFRLPQSVLHALVATPSTEPRWEYFLSAGLLYRHAQLYHAYPPRDSWFWTWYPNAPLWWKKLYNQSNTNETMPDW